MRAQNGGTHLRVPRAKGARGKEDVLRRENGAKKRHADEINAMRHHALRCRRHFLQVASAIRDFLSR